MKGPSLIGIISERDYARRMILHGRSSKETTVREVMTTPVACCRTETSLAEIRGVMTAKRIRHLPVVDEKGLCGIVTIGDLTAHEVTEHETTIEFLNSYIFDRR